MLMNARTEAPVAQTVELALTSAERRRGLLGRDSMAPDSALVITRCNAVHTIRMRFAIDIAFVDSSGIVKKIVRGLGPWRMAGALFASTAADGASSAASCRLPWSAIRWLSSSGMIRRPTWGRPAPGWRWTTREIYDGESTIDNSLPIVNLQL